MKGTVAPTSSSWSTGTSSRMTASFSVRITDVTPRNVFYLLQEPRFLVAHLPLRNNYALLRGLFTNR